MKKITRTILHAALFAVLLAAGLALSVGDAAADGRRHCRGCGPGWWWYDPFWGPGPYYGYGYARRTVIDQRLSRFALLDLDVDPEEAEVVLNGRPIGLADDFDGYPDFLYLRPGRYQVEFRIPGYESYRTELEVQAGRSYNFDSSLDLAPGQRRLRAGWGDEVPASATRRVWGPQGALSDDELRLDEDEDAPEAERQEIEEEDDDGEDEDEDRPLRRPATERDRRGPDDEDRDEPPTAPEPQAGYGAMAIEVMPADAAIWLDGTSLGTAEAFGGRIEATEGEHELVVMKPGHETRVLRIEIEAGTTESIVVSLEKIERNE